MYLLENSTAFTRISPNTENNSVSKMQSDLYILFAFMGIIMGSFVLFFTFNISKARRGARKGITTFAIDLPPRYSDVVPPTYEWVLEHHYGKDSQLKGYTISNLPAIAVICNCLLIQLQYCC